MAAPRINPVDGEPEPRVTMRAFDRALLTGDDEAERALFVIDRLPELDDDDDDPPERVLSAAERAAAEAHADEQWARPEFLDELAAAALAPLPPLTDDQCHKVSALLLSVPLPALDEL
jgi:hypothetical protein